MKTRNGWVANSSSAYYIITNKSNRGRSLYEFACENSGLLTDFNSEYSGKVTMENYLKSA